MSDEVRRILPNLITVVRLVMAAGFFAIIALALSPTSAEGRQWWGNAAFILFIAAALSDILDGLHGIDRLEDLTLVEVRQDGCCLAMVGHHSTAEDFCVIVLALDQGLTGEVILTTNLRRVELYVVGAS